MSDFETPTRRVLIVDRSRSYCAECGLGADPYETQHTTVLGASAPPDSVGCGVQWTHITSNDAGMEMALKGMRPDLTYIPAEEYNRPPE
jgi:hypothetical protein